MPSLTALTSFFSTKKAYVLAFVAIVGFGLGFRLLGLEKSIWLDEYITIKIISGQSVITQLKTLDVEPPLYFWLLKGWSSLGTNSAVLRLLSVLLGTCALVTIMLWMKLYSPMAGLLAGLLFATLPMTLRYSQELRAYPLVLFGTALSFLFASRLIRSPEKSINYWGLGSGLVISVLSHMTGSMVVATVFFFLLAQVEFRIRKLHIWKLLIAFGIPTLIFAYIYFFFLASRPNSGSWWMPALSVPLINTLTQALLGREGFLYGYSILATKAGPFLPILPWVVGAVVIVLVEIVLQTGKWKQTWSFLAAALVYGLGLVAYTAAIAPVLWTNTVLPMLIPGIGFAALQISSIRFELLKRISAGALIGMALINSTYWVTVQANPPVEPWKEVAAFVRQNADLADLVIYFPPYAAGPTEYYLGASAPSGRLLVNFVGSGQPGIRMPFGDNSLQIGAGDRAALNSAIDQYRAERASSSRVYKVFLVVRDGDPYVVRYDPLYKDLLASLENKTGIAPVETDFAGLSVRIYTVTEH